MRMNRSLRKMLARRKFLKTAGLETYAIQSDVVGRHGAVVLAEPAERDFERGGHSARYRRRHLSHRTVSSGWRKFTRWIFSIRIRVRRAAFSAQSRWVTWPKNTASDARCILRALWWPAWRVSMVCRSRLLIAGLLRCRIGPGLGVTLNEEAVKAHLVSNTGYFEPTPQWDHEPTRVNDRLWS